MASDIYLRLVLTISSIKGTFRRLPYSLSLQETLRSIIRATRLKFHGNGKLLQTRSQKTGCGMIDNLDTLLSCTGVAMLDAEEQEDGEKPQQFHGGTRIPCLGGQSELSRTCTPRLGEGV